MVCAKTVTIVLLLNSVVENSVTRTKNVLLMFAITEYVLVLTQMVFFVMRRIAPVIPNVEVINAKLCGLLIILYAHAT
jgi:uncharacterized membrane protein